MDQVIHLMLVDDHDVVRTGLKAFLDTQAGMKVVAEARNGSEALGSVVETKPDVIVMDISMPGLDGLQATRQIKDLLPSSHVLALTVHEDKQYFFQMMAAGATGYITKQAAAEELVAAIRAVAQGQIYLQPTLARWLLEDYRRLSEASPTAENGATSTEEGKSTIKEVGELSKRERQVLELVAEGRTNAQISETLGISPKTVARHRERIMAKLNLHSSTELVKYAIRTGLVEA